MLGISGASANLLSTGKGIDWQGTEMTSGTVKTGFAGGCLWVGAVGNGERFGGEMTVLLDEIAGKQTPQIGSGLGNVKKLG